MYKRKYASLAAACLITLVFGAYAAAAASNSCNTFFTNTLDEPITSIKILYDTPYGEMRPSSSEVVLPPGGQFRLGIQGVTLPTRIIVFLPLASYEFADLSGLAPEAVMRLEVAYKDGVPRLQREDDAQKSASGVEHKYLTPKNRPYAVDRDFLTDCKSMGQALELIAEKAREVREEKGEENAGLEGILFTESFDGRTTQYFPVFWMDHAGYAGATPLEPGDPDAGIGVYVNIPLPGNNAPEALDELMSDLRVDGYRPAMFQCNAREEDGDKEVNFLEGSGDKYDDQEVVQEHLAAALGKGTLREAEILWIKADAFEKAKADGDYAQRPAVRVRIANGQFQAIFIP